MADTTLYPTADALLVQAAPDNNFGGHTYNQCRTVSGGENRRSFLKFGLDTLPAGAVISLAKLRLDCYAILSAAPPATNVQARRVADDSWTELGITWNNQKAYGDVEDTKVPAVGWVEWDVTSFVQAEFAGDKIVSICLRCVTEDYDGTIRYSNYRSKEYNGSDPELYVEYSVPIAHEVTITESLGMLETVAKIAAFKKTVTDKIGMLDSVPAPIGAFKIAVPTEKLGMLDTIKAPGRVELEISDSVGMLDSTPTKAAFHLIVSDKIGLFESIASKAAFHLTVSDILGLVDTTSTKAAFKQAVTDVLGMLDSATRGFPLAVTISEILGLRDRIVTRKRIWPLRDLPDDTIQGGA